MKAKSLYIISKLIAIIPILSGSIIFWVWFFYPVLDMMPLYGIWSVVISVPLCLGGIILAIIFRIQNKSDTLNKKKGGRIIMLTILNVPLAYFYLWFGAYLFDTQRITFINNCGSPIQQVHIFGCGYDKTIPILGDDKHRTIWVHMEFEGKIEIEYKRDEQKIHEIVDEYTGPNMGNGSKYSYVINLLAEQ